MYTATHDRDREPEGTTIVELGLPWQEQKEENQEEFQVRTRWHGRPLLTAPARSCEDHTRTAQTPSPRVHSQQRATHPEPPGVCTLTYLAGSTRKTKKRCSCNPRARSGACGLGTWVWMEGRGPSSHPLSTEISTASGSAAARELQGRFPFVSTVFVSFPNFYFFLAICPAFPLRHVHATHSPPSTRRSIAVSAVSCTVR